MTGGNFSCLEYKNCFQGMLTRKINNDHACRKGRSLAIDSYHLDQGCRVLVS